MLRLARFGFVAGLPMWSLVAGFASAQPADSLVPPPRAAIAERMSDLETFLDGIVTASLKQHSIGGAQVAVVADGRTLLVKGYGLADIAPDRPVDPQRSLFRIGSISKTMTWIAMMQLVEQGRVSLDDPVNEYLPDALKIQDDGYSQPIRIIDLMNHTAGFEDSIQRLFIDPSTPVLPLQDHLRKFRPARVREPGMYFSYSNYGVALAGALIAHVTGTEYERYIEENVLAPLGMSHTTFREAHGSDDPATLPAQMAAELAEDVATGLELRDGVWRAYPQERILSMAPAGSAVSTAADMARYMSALLDPGLLEQAGVLERSTYDLMRQPSFQGAPGLPAVHHGFFNMPLAVKRPLGFDNLSHSGGTLHFQSLMVLIPDLQLPNGESGSLGVFVTTNSRTGAVLARSLTEDLLTKYFADAAAPAAQPIEEPHDLSDYEGRYRGLQASHTKLEKVFGLMRTVRVKASGDGVLTVSAGSDELRLVEIADDLFRQQTGELLLAFNRDARGRVTHMISVAGTSERIGPFETLQWLSAIASTVLVASIAILIGAMRRRRVPEPTRWARRPARWLSLASAFWLVFWVLVVTWFVSLTGPDLEDEFLLTYPQLPLLAALTALLLAAAASIVALAMLIAGWQEQTWSLWRRVGHSAAVAAFLAFVATAAYWNMLGFRFY